MVILGRIVDLRRSLGGCMCAASHSNGSLLCDELEKILSMLGSFKKSLSDLVDQLPLTSVNSKSATLGSSKAIQVQDGSGKPFEATTVAAYARFVMHVLELLSRAKWDPTSIFEDQDLWISSKSFGRAMSSALSAAEAMEDILQYDPGLTYMPYFIRAYLVQGSLIPLLALETLGSDCNPSVIKACKTIVKAHEACVMTLDSEFQVRCMTLS